MAILGNEEDVIVTNDPDHIEDWIEEHGGKPARTDSSGSVDVELAIKFEDEDDEDLEEIEWEEFFLILDEKDLAFAYVAEERPTLDSQKYDFVERKEANIEIEEDEVFMNTLETAGDEDRSVER